jgi:large-conductance mechanosensitive channel
MNKLNTKGLEKSIEFRYFMIFSSFIFYVDSVWLTIGEGGFEAHFKSFELKATLIPQSILILGFFYLLMALVFPVLRKVIQFLLMTLTNKFETLKKQKTNNGDERYVSSVKRKALLEKDSFWLAEIEKREEEIAERETNLNLNFSLLILVLINWLIVGSSKEVSISQFVSQIYEYDFGWFLNWFIHFSIIVFCGFLLFAAFASLFTDVEDKVFYPEEPKPPLTKEEFNKNLTEQSPSELS